MSVPFLTRMIYPFLLVWGVKGAHMFTWSSMMRLEWGGVRSGPWSTKLESPLDRSSGTKTQGERSEKTFFKFVNLKIQNYSRQWMSKKDEQTLTFHRKCNFSLTILAACSDSEMERRSYFRIFESV